MNYIFLKTNLIPIQKYKRKLYTHKKFSNKSTLLILIKEYDSGSVSKILQNIHPNG